MKSKIIISFVSLILITGFISNLEAQRRYKGDFPPPPPYLLEQLKLTDAQKTKFDELRFNHQKEMINLRSELEQKQLELRKYRSEGNLSRSKVVGLTKEINEIRNKISLARANHQMDIYELLDDTQRKIWHENRPFGLGPGEWGYGKKFHRNWRNFCW